MREACIILPKLATGVGVGERQRTVAWLISRLVDEFGGVTITEGHGWWKAPDGIVTAERVELFTVAVPWQFRHDAETAPKTIRNLALQAGEDLLETAVYVRYPNGDVQILEVW